MAYLVSVSFVAIVLSGYYIFLWHPPPGGSLSLRDPHSEYLMENSPSNNRSISEIIERMNLFRKNTARRRGLNRTSSHHDRLNIDNSTKINFNHTWEYPDTSPGVYDSVTHQLITIPSLIETKIPEGSHALETSDSSTSEGIQERTTAKPNVTESLEKEKLVYPPVYLEENQPIERPELEASLNPLPTINPTSAEYQDISVENVEEPLGIEFDSDRLTRR
ncbi:uncharacterized protein [Fopius arisanus]|nr:PREDICTED: uncharacterized protein LOC105272322 isoform X2 [Fopius arisanus]